MNNRPPQSFVTSARGGGLQSISLLTVLPHNEFKMRSPVAILIEVNRERASIVLPARLIPEDRAER